MHLKTAAASSTELEVLSPASNAPPHSSAAGRSTSGQSTSITLLNHGSSEAPHASVIVINSVVTERQQAHLVKALMDFLSQRNPQAYIYIAAAVLMNSVPGNSQQSYQMMLNGAELPAAVSHLPQLSADLPLKDNMLAVLMHFAIATGKPLGLILVPGHRLTAAAAAGAKMAHPSQPESDEEQQLASLVAACVNVQLDTEFEAATAALSISTGRPQRATNDVMYL